METHQVQVVVASQDRGIISLQGPNRYPNRYPTDTQLSGRHAESNQLPCSLPWSCQNALCTTSALTCTEKLRFSSRSCQSLLRILLKSCDFPAGAGSWQSVLRILHLYGKVTTFELELPKHCKPTQRKKTILTDTRA